MTGDELKVLREKAGLTQTELARLARLYGQVTISKYEKGLRSISEPMALLFRLIFLRDTVKVRQYRAHRAAEDAQRRMTYLYGPDTESMEAHGFQGRADESAFLLKLIDEILAS